MIRPVSIPSGNAIDVNGTDQELVERFRSGGDEDAFAALVARHVAMVRHMIRRVVLDPAAADDLTQETFVRACRKLDDFRGRGAFRGWLKRIAVNVAVDHARKRKHAPAPADFETAAPVSDGPQATLARVELRAEIDRAMASLPAEMRAAVVLVCIEGATAVEAASVLGCPIGTVYWRVHEGRRRLARALGEYLP